MKRQNIRTLALIVCTFTYLLLGAAVFDALESKKEGMERQRLSEQELNWRTKYNISQDDFEKITQLGIQLKPYRAGTQWKFAGAFYFATTVVTTIGYGHCTPKTVGGKIFCMVYALPGIPLCIVMFQSIGERINTLITCILRRLKAFLRCQNKSISQTNLIFVSANVGTIVLTVGAAVFAQYERWQYLDAFYYCFITLTTIGFGDFVALQREDSLAKRPDYVAFSLIFILFGLTVVSSVMNLLVLRFLTMNTDDQRRDELEAAAQAQELRRLHGDVIHSVIGVTGRLIQSGSDTGKNQTSARSIETYLEDSKRNARSNSRACMNPVSATLQSSPSWLSRLCKLIHQILQCLGCSERPEDEQSSKQDPVDIMDDDRPTGSFSYTESENLEGEGSPWVSRSTSKPGTEYWSSVPPESQTYLHANECEIPLLHKNNQRIDYLQNEASSDHITPITRASEILPFRQQPLVYQHYLLNKNNSFKNLPQESGTFPSALQQTELDIGCIFSCQHDRTACGDADGASPEVDATFDNPKHFQHMFFEDYICVDIPECVWTGQHACKVSVSSLPVQEIERVNYFYALPPDGDGQLDSSYQSLPQMITQSYYRSCSSSRASV